MMKMTTTVRHEEPFNIAGIHDLAIAICKKIGIPERALTHILRFELTIGHKTSSLTIEYFDSEALPEPVMVLQEFELLGRPLKVENTPVSALRTEEPEAPEVVDHGTD